MFIPRGREKMGENETCTHHNWEALIDLLGQADLLPFFREYLDCVVRLVCTKPAKVKRFFHSLITQVPHLECGRFRKPLIKIIPVLDSI